MAKFHVVHGSIKVGTTLFGPGEVVELTEAQAKRANEGCDRLDRPAVVTEVQWKALEQKKAAEAVLAGKPAPEPKTPVEPKGGGK